MVGPDGPRYEVERIVMHRDRAGQKEMFVHWKGYDASHGRWVSRASLAQDVPGLVAAYERSPSTLVARRSGRRVRRGHRSRPWWWGECVVLRAFACSICTGLVAQVRCGPDTRKKTQTEWRSKWGFFGWANARRGAQWIRKEKPPSSRGRPRRFQLVGLLTFCETASATFR